jgi:hypothetical protein
LPGAEGLSLLKLNWFSRNPIQRISGLSPFTLRTYAIQPSANLGQQRPIPYKKYYSFAAATKHFFPRGNVKS